MINEAEIKKIISDANNSMIKPLVHEMTVQMVDSVTKAFEIGFKTGMEVGIKFCNNNGTTINDNSGC